MDVNAGDRSEDTLERLERDYLRGALPAEDYARLRSSLLRTSAADSVPAQQTAELQTAQPGTSRGGDPLTGAQLASWGRRAAAWLIDIVVLGVVWVAVFAWAFTTEDSDTGEISDGAAIAIFFAIFLLGPVYQWLMVGQWGQTLGKMAVGVRVARGEDAARIGYARALGRVASILVLGFFTLPILLAYLWPLWDRRNQTLYDKMTNTIVVRMAR